MVLTSPSMLTIPTTDPLLQEFLRQAETAATFHRGDRLLLAVSGGLTSTALAVLCASIREAWELTLHLGHIEETPDAERAARALGARLRLPLHTAPRRGDHGEKDTQGVDLSALRTIREMTESRVIATGETRDSQEETLLASFLRGASLDDLGGLAPIAGEIIRPLLPISRKECRLFLERHQIPYSQCPDRLSLAGAEQRVRLLLLPIIRHHIQPALSSALDVSTQLLRDDAAFLRALSDAARSEVSWNARPHEVTVNAPRLRVLPPSLRRRLLADAFRLLAPEQRVPPEDLLRLDREIHGGNTGTARGTLAPLSIERSGDTLLIRRA